LSTVFLARAAGNQLPVTVHFVHSNLCTEIANSDFAHVCLGFITHKQRENASRRQRV